MLSGVLSDVPSLGPHFDPQNGVCENQHQSGSMDPDSGAVKPSIKWGPHLMLVLTHPGCWYGSLYARACTMIVMIVILKTKRAGSGVHLVCHLTVGSGVLADVLDQMCHLER